MQYPGNLLGTATVLTIGVILIPALVFYWVMAPSEVAKVADSSSTNTEQGVESRPTANGSKNLDSKSQSKDTTLISKSNTQQEETTRRVKAEQKGSTQENKEEKAAFAESKKKAKAEKQARRAQKISESTPVQLPREKLVERPRRASQSAKTPGEPVLSPKENRSALVNGFKPKQAQKSQATNTSISQAKPAPPTENLKRVALFRHLYYKDTQTPSIAKEKKDVHPAVLALGLQIRNYVICGSSARCVAMLLTFKRVRFI